MKSQRMTIVYVSLHFLTLYAAIVYEEPTRSSDNVTVNMSAWAGQEVKMLCEDDPQEIAKILLWQKGDNMLAENNTILTHNESIIPNKNELRIAKLKPDDEGLYRCIIPRTPIYIKEFALRIKGLEELKCSAPEFPSNGGFHRESKQNAEYHLYGFGEKTQYYCNKGYVLDGEEVRTCTDPNNGWTGETPYCEPDYAVRIKKRLEKEVAMLQHRVSILEERVAVSEVKSDLASDIQVRMDEMNTTLKNLQLATNESRHRSIWGNVLESKIASLAVQSDRLVSEFTWFVENITEKIKLNNAQNVTQFLLSGAFYTNIPGYRMRLSFNPNFKMENYIVVGTRLLLGEFDSLLVWPFPYKYELSILSSNNKVIETYIIDPHDYSECSEFYKRPLIGHSYGCDFKYSFSTDSILINESSVLHGDRILLRIRIFLQ